MPVSANAVIGLPCLETGNRRTYSDKIVSVFFHGILFLFRYLTAYPRDDSVHGHGLWNTENMVRPILGAVAKRFDKIKYVNVLDADLSQFATSVMGPCLISRRCPDVV